MSNLSDDVTRPNIYPSHEKDWTKIHKFPVRVAESKTQKLHHHVSDVNVVLIVAKKSVQNIDIQTEILQRVSIHTMQLISKTASLLPKNEKKNGL